MTSDDDRPQWANDLEARVEQLEDHLEADDGESEVDAVERGLSRALAEYNLGR